MPRPLLAHAAACALLLAILPSGCREERDEVFRALGVVNGDTAISRNQDIVLLFSKPLARKLIPGQAVRVDDVGGTPIAVMRQPRGRRLVIRPRSPLGWDTGEVRVRVVYPTVGRDLESVDGEPNGAEFEVRVPVRGDYQRIPGRLELTFCSLPSGASGIVREPSLDDPFVVDLHFNAPLDVSTLRNGIQIIDTERRMALRDFEIRRDPRDPSRVRVAPFSSPEPEVAGGLSYELRLTRQLRSVDGRALVRDVTREFSTRDGGRRLLRFDFSSPDSLDPDSPLKDLASDGVLRPRRPRDEPLVLGHGANASTTEIFSSAASRVQILIPHEDLRRVGGPFVIEGLSFQATSAIPIEAEVSDLVVTLGYMPYGRELGSDFADNQNSAPRSVVVPLVRDGAAVRLRPPGAREPDVIRLRFAEPFLYDGSERSLVLELTSPYGVSSPLGFGAFSVPVEGIDASQRAGEAPSMVIGRPGDRSGRLSRFRPLMGLLTVRYPPAISRWQRLSDAVMRPTFSHDSRRDCEARGWREDQEFTLRYRGGIPDRLGQDEIVQPWTEWFDHVHSLPPECRAIQVMVEFHPALDLEGDPSAGIESINVHYENRD